MAGFLTTESSIEIIRGSSRTLALTVTDGEGDPVNLTGGRIIMTVKCRISDSEVLFQKDSDEGAAEIEITNASSGEAKIYIQPSDTSGLAAASYVFDVWVLLSSGSRHLVIGPGTFVVKAGVTVLS